MQLENNDHIAESSGNLSSTTPDPKKFAYRAYDKIIKYKKFDGSVKIDRVVDAGGNDLLYTAVKTMLRVDLANSLQQGEIFQMQIDWYYNINNIDVISARIGYEYFEEDKNHIFEIAALVSSNGCIY